MEQTTNTQVNPGKHASTYGIVLGVILILIAIVMYVTGMALRGEQWPMYIFYVIFPLIIVTAIISYKKENEGFLNLGQAIKVGLATAVISAVLYLFYNLLFSYVIEPTWVEQVIEASRTQMNEMGNLTEEQIEMGLASVKWATDPLIGSAIWLAMSSFFGLIYSLIAGLVMKQKRPYEV